ncbi:MAG TPA: hypothetical protein VFW65_36980 [Pseudonocardiaceae bacterium]|nr:hypothetical protein [Pseudonocardiaceae bacterium]
MTTSEQLLAAAGGSTGTAELAGLLVAAATDPELARTTERLLAEGTPRLWSALDDSTRGHWWQQPSWASAILDRLVSGAPRPLELVVAGCHASGYAREAAVVLMGKSRRPVYAPVLALRTADWVPEVRDRARQVCERWLADSPATALLGLGPLAFTLDRRANGAWLADMLRTLLHDGSDDILAAGLAANDWRVRRAAHLTGLAAHRIDVDRMVTAALTDPDPPIRTACAEALIRRSPSLARPLLASRTAAIRADAIHVLGWAGDAAPARAALLDNAHLVRLTAQATVRRTGTDPAEHYRARLHETPAAIAGLGETGTAVDRELVWPWLRHPLPRGRAAAVRALRRLGAQPIPRVVPLLTDPSPSVVRQAAAFLLERLIEPYEARFDRRSATAAASSDVVIFDRPLMSSSRAGASSSDLDSDPASVCLPARRVRPLVRSMLRRGASVRSITLVGSAGSAPRSGGWPDSLARTRSRTCCW